MNFSLALAKLNAITNNDINKDAELLIKLEELGIANFDKCLANIPQYKDYGDIIIEEWPEGLVVWVGGKIKYTSWEDNQK